MCSLKVFHLNGMLWVQFYTFCLINSQCCSYFCFMLILLLWCSKAGLVGRCYLFPNLTFWRQQLLNKSYFLLKADRIGFPQSVLLLWFMMFEQSTKTKPTMPSAFWEKESQYNCRHVYQTPTVILQLSAQNKINWNDLIEYNTSLHK